MVGSLGAKTSRVNPNLYILKDSIHWLKLPSMGHPLLLLFIWLLYHISYKVIKLKRQGTTKNLMYVNSILSTKVVFYPYLYSYTLIPNFIQDFAIYIVTLCLTYSIHSLILTSIMMDIMFFFHRNRYSI